MVDHPIKPVYDKNSKVLILGSFPSVKSREANFFYGHPQNRFWKVLAAVFEADVPITVEEKRTFYWHMVWQFGMLLSPVILWGLRIAVLKM